jgi:hypothetical protein
LQVFIKSKNENISGNHATAYQQKLAGDFPSFNDFS